MTEHELTYQRQTSAPSAWQTGLAVALIVLGALYCVAGVGCGGMALAATWSRIVAAGGTSPRKVLIARLVVALFTLLPLITGALYLWIGNILLRAVRAGVLSGLLLAGMQVGASAGGILLFCVVRTNAAGANVLIVLFSLNLLANVGVGAGLFHLWRLSARRGIPGPK